MADFKNEYDDFWDVSKLVPKSKPVMSPFSTGIRVSEVVIEDKESAKNKKSERKIDFSAFEAERGEETSSKEPYSYYPKNNKLLKKITIKPSIDRFDFYDTFRKAALIYFDYKCPKSDFVSFYSYKPQYSQMTAEQKKYYFYWRDRLRLGSYLKTDYSYIYLYAYEILNLPEKIGKEEGLSLLCDVWRAYRDELPRLDVSFALWVQDYCLVYELDCPFDKIKDFLFDVINASSFKEFYLSDLDKGGNGASAMIAYLSDYDWRRGKYAGGESAVMYRMHVEGAMQRVFSILLSGDIISKSGTTKLTRSAFAGSLCTHTVKCNLEIEYSSIADSPELRREVTAAVKYTENKLRACLGVKSRLAVRELSDSVRYVIDKYFESEFERLRREKERANAPEYERLYDAPDSKATFEDAVEIERASWKMTARLIEGIEELEEDNADNKADETKVTSEPKLESVAFSDEDCTDSYGLGETELKFLEFILADDVNSAYSLAKEKNLLPDAVAEKINEAFSDNFGDVILEETDMGKYKIIDDYYEEITEWLRKITK